MTLAADIERAESIVLCGQHRLELLVRIDRTGEGVTELAVEFMLGGVAAAGGLLRFEAREVRATLGRTGDGVKLTVRALQGPGDRWRQWALKLRTEGIEPVVQMVEVGSIAGSWRLRFAGDVAHVQRQSGFDTMPSSQIDLRLGAFTQHGQLPQFKDWLMVERDGGNCTGLLALRPGSWTAGAAAIARVRGESRAQSSAFMRSSAAAIARMRGESEDGGVSVDFPLPSEMRIRRSYALVFVPAAEALQLQKVGFRDFEPADGYAVWPAAQLARLGFARPERLAAYARGANGATKPTRFAFGEAKILSAARHRIERYPELAGGNPFWLGDFSRAKDEVLGTLRQSAHLLASAGYLHPLGNPVAQRVLAPAFATFHMLDWEGHLNDEERQEGARLIATLAELLLRRDFYPHHVATLDQSSPQSVDSLYRGMLNQNFNTDRFATVGLAGCVLPNHPHAARWRRHAIEQFREQMRAFVHPGGAWEESHTYANHVKMLLMPLVLALRHAPEPVDLMADDRFRATCRFFIPLLSPRDSILDGRRGIPAIGDHFYGKHGDFGTVFGWLATMVRPERDKYLWAWHETGTQLSDPHSRQINTFSPLMIPDPEDRGNFKPSALAALVEADAYGVAARRDAGTNHESLLVIRCGESWAHYHHDQGSFWWWAQGRLVCADSDLGGGPLKFEHCGHNVLGYLNRTPMQYLDRTPFRIKATSIDAEGHFLVRCSVPVTSWQTGQAADEAIPLLEQPHLTRTFEWNRDDTLTITDEPQRSPEGIVTWSLHVVATNAVQTAARQIVFQLAPDRHLRLTLPAEPRRIALLQTGRTWGVTLEYPEGLLRHHLAMDSR